MNSISIYRDSLSIPFVISQLKRIKQAFPKLQPDFYDLLLDRIKENGFTDRRLKDAVDKLIDNFSYPVPTIANLVSFDKRIKLLTYSDLLSEHNRTGKAFNDYVSITRNGQKYWVKKSEKEEYNFPDEL